MPEVLEENSSSTPPPSRLEQMRSMSLIEYLEELRRRIIWAIVAVGVGFAACWHYSVLIFGYMQKPIVQALEANKLDTSLVYTNPTEPFNLYRKVGLVAGIFIASPLVLYQVWLFISPGLYRHEKRYVLPFMFSTVGLFLSARLFGYRMVYPAALNFLTQYGKQFQPMITIGEYTDLFLTIIVGLGVIFELLIVIFYL